MNERINLIKLKQEFKSYRAVCEFLHEKVKGGDSKKAQVDDWWQYFRWEIKGYRWTVTEILIDNPIIKEDGRVNNGQHPNSKSANSIYAPYIDKLLLNHIKSSDTVSYITRNQIAEITGMVNKSYRNTLEVESAFRGYVRNRLDITNKSAFRNVYFGIKDITGKPIERSLPRLQRQGYIRHKQGYILSISTKLSDEYKGYEEGTVTRMATIKETSQIKTIERDILLEFKVGSKKELKSRLSSYFARVNEEVKKLYPEILFLYQGYEIIKTDNMDEVELLEAEETKQLRQDLNNIVKDKLIDKFNNDYAKIKDKDNMIMNQLVSSEDGSIDIALEYWESEILEDCYISSATEIMELIVDVNVGVLEIGDIVKE